MNRVFFFYTLVIGFFLCSTAGFGVDVLVLGDSHMYGKFGQTLHEEISRKIKGNVLSIASCPAAPKTYTEKTIKAVCGLKVRQSFYSHQKFTTPPKVIKKGVKTKIRNLGYYLNRLRPAVVVVALGTNMGNLSSSRIAKSTRDFIRYVRAHKPSPKIVWIGPPNYRGSIRIAQAIKESLLPLGIEFIDGRDFNIRSPLPRSNPHFGPRRASQWARFTVGRLAQIKPRPPKKAKVPSLPSHCYIKVGDIRIPSLSFAKLNVDKGSSDLSLKIVPTIADCNVY